MDNSFYSLQELLPVIETAGRLRSLASWKYFYRSGLFLLVACYMILWGWIQYILPTILVFYASLMLWRRHFNSRRQIKVCRVTCPPNGNAAEQLLTLQEGIAQVESLMQAANINLLKMRAFLLALLPQATEKAALLLVLMAAVIALVAVKLN